MRWSVRLAILLSLTLVVGGCERYGSCGLEEIPYNGEDDDCDPATPDDDLDGDGFLRQDDCDDNEASVHPGAIDHCDDGVDQDCDGRDEDCACQDPADEDLDGHLKLACGGRDCDDTDPAVHPGALEVCDDGVDNDCNGSTDADNELCDDGDPETTADHCVDRVCSGYCDLCSPFIDLTASTNAVPADGVSSVALTVEVYRADGTRPGAGEVITFLTDRGWFESSGDPMLDLETDADGGAVAMLVGGDEPGIATVDASVYLDGDYASDDVTIEVTPWPDIYPECEERGGQCTWVNDLDDTCPVGTYNPFSGHLRMCPTGSIQLCCVPVGGLGSSCTYDDPCDDGGCLAEQSGYPPDGFCSAICDPTQFPTGCPDWAVCIPVYFSAAMGMCMLPCSQDEHCREGWSCQAFPTRPFDPDPGTAYVCWSGTGPMGNPAGLGAPCAVEHDCLSMQCLPDPSGQHLCSAWCDANHPCLTGYTCTDVAGVSACFPE